MPNNLTKDDILSPELNYFILNKYTRIAENNKPFCLSFLERMVKPFELAKVDFKTKHFREASKFIDNLY